MALNEADLPQSGELALQRLKQEQRATEAGIGALQAFGFLGSLGRWLQPGAEEQERRVTVPLISSCLAEVTYDRDGGTLLCVFTDGGSHIYAGVPETVFQELIDAPSVGTYFNLNVRNVF